MRIVRYALRVFKRTRGCRAHTLPGTQHTLANGEVWSKHGHYFCSHRSQAIRSLPSLRKACGPFCRVQNRSILTPAVHNVSAVSLQSAVRIGYFKFRRAVYDPFAPPTFSGDHMESTSWDQAEQHLLVEKLQSALDAVRVLTVHQPALVSQFFTNLRNPLEPAVLPARAEIALRELIQELSKPPSQVRRVKRQPARILPMPDRPPLD